MLQGNLFASNNKFKRQQKKTVLALEDNFKSFRVKDEKFTNYFETNKSIEYKILKQIYDDYKSGVNILNKYFNNPGYLHLGPGQTEKINRVFRISLNANGKIIRHVEIGNVFKLNLKDEYCNDKIRFYFKKEDGKLNLLFIDLFHLGILTRNQNLEKEYERYKNFNGNILDIKKD